MERFDNCLSQTQVTESNTDDRIRNAVDNAVIAVEKCMHDAILRAVNDVVTPRVLMAVRFITGSPGNGPNSIVPNPDRRDVTGNTENSLLRLDSSRLDLNIKQDDLDEIRDIDNSEYDDIPATRLNYDRRVQAHRTFRSFFTPKVWRNRCGRESGAEHGSPVNVTDLVITSQDYIKVEHVTS